MIRVTVSAVSRSAASTRSTAPTAMRSGHSSVGSHSNNDHKHKDDHSNTHAYFAPLASICRIEAPMGKSSARVVPGAALLFHVRVVVVIYCGSFIGHLCVPA